MTEAVEAHQSRRLGWFAQMRPKRFQFLLCVFLAYTVVTPVLGQEAPARFLSAIVSCLAFVQTCVSIVPKKRVLLVSGVLAFLLSVYGSLVVAIDHPPFNGMICQASAKVIAILFYSFASVLIFRDVIKEGAVDMNKLCGAVCLYIMIGVLWGQFYQLCDVMDHGCFLLDLSKLERHGALNYFERASLFNYFSFVTLSTLGYGDISPVTRLTRTLAYTEALLGQIYMAVLVSRLVGLHIAASTAQVSNDD